MSETSPKYNPLLNLSTSLLDYHFRAQRRKTTKILKNFSTVLYFLYTVLPFFKKAYMEIETDITAVIFSIPYPQYDIIEIVIMVLMIFNRIFQLHMKNRKKLTTRNVILVSILVIVIFTNIVARNWLVDLIVRPFFLICYSTSTLKLAVKFGKIISGNILYYMLMWTFIIVASSVGHMLFKQYNMATENIFNIYWDALFELIVLQSTANYPDVALPYYQFSKPNIIFFIIFIFSSTVTINGFIIASSYRINKLLNKQDESRESLFMLRDFVKIKQKKMREDKAIMEAGHWRLFAREMLLNPFLELLVWTLNVMVFMLSCYYPEYYTDSVLSIMFIFMLITSLQCVLKAFTKPIGVIFLRPFLLYDILLALSGLVICLLVISKAVDETTLRVYMFFRTPLIVKPILLLMFKNRVISNSAITNNITGNIAELTFFNRFMPQFLRIVFLLFITLLFFSAVGQMAFAGGIDEESRDILDRSGFNHQYVYLNFNNTLTSFNTLFTLLIVNNWNLIVGGYVAIFGTRLVRIFFIMHYMAAVLVAYNIVIASIIEFVTILSEYKLKDVKISENSPIIKDQDLDALREVVEFFIENEMVPPVPPVEVVEKPSLIELQLTVIYSYMKRDVA